MSAAVVAYGPCSRQPLSSASASPSRTVTSHQLRETGKTSSSERPAASAWRIRTASGPRCSRRTAVETNGCWPPSLRSLPTRCPRAQAMAEIRLVQKETKQLKSRSRLPCPERRKNRAAHSTSAGAPRGRLQVLHRRHEHGVQQPAVQAPRHLPADRLAVAQQEFVFVLLHGESHAIQRRACTNRSIVTRTRSIRHKSTAQLSGHGRGHGHGNAPSR